MEAKNQLNFRMKYFGSEGRFSNFLLRGTLIAVIGQQVYFPQELKYFHLAIIFTYMIFLEFFKGDRRAFYEEYVLVASILSCSIISIIENISGLHLSFLYLIALYLGIFLTIKLILRINRIVSTGKGIDMFTEENQKMLKKGTAFIKVLTTCIAAILLVASVFGLYELIILF